MMRKRFLLFALLLSAFVLAPSLSLADDGFGGSVGGSFDGDYGVKYTTVTHDGDWTGFLVRASDSWSAAVYACGGDPARISADVRSRLSDPNYGGAFYMYATNYAHIMSVYEIPDFVPLYVLAGLGISSAWHGEFGDMMLWYADTPNSLLESAMVDLQRVLSGEDLGGGGSGGDVNVSECVVLQCQPYFSDTGSAPPDTGYSNARNATIDSSGNVVLGSGYTRYSSFSGHQYYTSSVRFYVPISVFEYLSDNYAGKKYSFGLGMLDRNDHAIVNLFVADDFRLVWTDMGYYSGNNLYFTGDTFYSESRVPAYHDSQGVFFVVPESSVPLSLLGLDHVDPSYCSSFYDVVSGSSGTWPEPVTPVTPDPPEVPTPTAPTVTPDPDVTEPSVTWPDIDITVNPPAVVVPTTPEGQDYTSLLTLINDNLNSIDAYTVAINSSLNSLRSDLLVGFDSVVSAIRNVYTYLRHLDDLFERHCKHIRDSIDDNFYELELYLKGLFEWLPEQLSFDSSYDDSAVVDWLRQIYYKLGGGTYAPNPVADPGGFFDWLGGLIAGFLASLLAGLPGKIQELLSDIGDLTGYFPFSAPWDLYALLALFSHEPVIPVFTIPWGMGGGHTANVVVDCSQWDGVMSIVRSVEKIIFAGGLAKLTFDMFKPTDVAGD